MDFEKIFRMNIVPLTKSDIPVERENYWNAVFLYHSSPHLVNRRVLSVSQLYFLKVFFKHDNYNIKDILNYTKLETETRNLKSIDSSCVNESFITKLFDQHVDNFSYEISDVEAVKDSDNIKDVFISVRILFPRNTKSEKCLEIVIIDKENCITTFLPICYSRHAICPAFSYEIVLNNKNLLNLCVYIENAKEKASEWLTNILFRKLMSWTEIKEFNTTIKKSLTLVSNEKYCNLYHELKLKYGDSIVKNWPENTDPLKFVYEDVAIATYLLLLWQKTPKSQKFVDLGCGNGLLVHILAQEGHTGYGIDVRPRKIWSLYGENTKLKVETIVPSSNYTFPDTNWIIGNHSDELTPWIPVIAARSSQTCNYFLLPCCCYEFNGKKYQRKNSSQSQYQEYLQYVKNISDTCGFKTEIDRLRIPSTKRICLVGVERQTTDRQIIDEKITNLINTRCGTNSDDNKCWVENFEARPTTEKVRNCTKLDKTLIANIVKKIVDHLLIEASFVEISPDKRWNKGSSVHLSDLVKTISPGELKQLKNECGGLQTLLKNHHYVFLVKNGSVQLRIPNNGNTDKKFHKKTQCWFYLNHPDGCLLDANDCTYLH